MYEKKYELVKEGNSNLYRIRALRDFSDVKAGDLGGYVESEFNLSQHDDCWIYDDSMACDEALVSQDARLMDASTLKGAAVINDHATVMNSLVQDDACISGAAIVKNMDIDGSIFIGGQAEIDDSWQGHILTGMASFHWTPVHYIVLGPIGTRSSYVTFYKATDHLIWVDTGCYSGEIDEFAERVKQVHYIKHMRSYKEYMTAIRTAKKILTYKERPFY